MKTKSPSEINIEIKGLNKYFGKIRAVNSIDFSFKSGEVHGFIGPNGAGKTTTMRIIATIDYPDSGDILINNCSAINYPDKLRPILGFMPDYLETYDDMVVDEYLDFYSRAYRLEGSFRKKRLAAVSEFTGLTPLLERPVNGLSKGQKQRLGLGRVLINDPSVLILDEPAAGLDPRARVELRDVVRELAVQGKAILISSHILSELAELCDSVTIIENGTICASDTVNDLQTNIDSGTRVSVLINQPDEQEKIRLIRALAEMPGVSKCEENPGGANFFYQGTTEIRTKILMDLIGKNFKITDFHTTTSSLEETFLTLTDPISASRSNKA
jgi:ABC-2 type transport system ATP-binding protein